jgi:hypothetical protein
MSYIAIVPLSTLRPYRCASSIPVRPVRELHDLACRQPGRFIALLSLGSHRRGLCAPTRLATPSTLPNVGNTTGKLITANAEAGFLTAFREMHSGVAARHGNTVGSGPTADPRDRWAPAPDEPAHVPPVPPSHAIPDLATMPGHQCVGAALRIKGLLAQAVTARR